ncbi:MAG: pyruvate kinase [Bacteroidales bacterium]|nr:pyruvate kinase [Bacteroidales bacterium]MCF8404492.1 pyruvate kinase [Bacteroidales bacterium]
MKKTEFLLTKIIATLGPASSNLETIEALINSGARIFRVNFSHGRLPEHRKLIKNIRKAEKNTNQYVSILGDLSGPKIRIGEVIKEGIYVLKGQEVFFVKESLTAGKVEPKNTFSSTSPGFIDEVEVGERILIDDGNINLECNGKVSLNGQEALKCTVISGGLITSAKGINLPDTELTVDALTPKDYECINFAVEHSFDFLALSFVRKREDIAVLKKRLKELNCRPDGADDYFRRNENFSLSKNHEKFIPIITKIEKPQAIRNLDSIIDETDVIMVARGDLGVEMDLAEVAILQKEILHKCHEYGKPVIVATQMLQSMIEAPVPTRAEVSDVANAIFDGADAIMLSGETAVGNYPEKAVAMMRKIAKKTNAFIQDRSITPGTLPNMTAILYKDASIAHGVDAIARELKPKFIVVWTNYGGTAIYLSQLRLPVPILAFSHKKERLRLLTLLYGVKPMFMAKPGSGSAFIKKIEETLIARELVEKGDPLIVVSGDPISRPGLANRIVVHKVGD